MIILALRVLVVCVITYMGWRHVSGPPISYDQLIKVHNLTKREIDPGLKTSLINQVSEHGHHSYKSEVCHVDTSKGKVEIKPDHESCEVKTFYGSFKMSTDQIQNTDFRGPIQVDCGDCHSKVVCDYGEEKDDLSSHLRKCPLCWLLVTLLMLLTVLLTIAVRYIWFRYHWSPRGYRLFSSTGGLTSFVQKYVDSPKDRSLNYSLRREGEMILPSEGASYKFMTVSKALLMKVLILTLIPISKIVKVDAVQEQAWFSEGTSVTIDNEEIYINRARYLVPLQFNYYTAPWQASLDSDYWCTDAKCSATDPCNSYNPTGNWSSLKVSGAGQPGKPERMTIQKNYCSSPAGDCFFRGGCWKWSITYDIVTNLLFRVFSLQDAIPIVEVSHSHKKALTIQQVDLFQYPQRTFSVVKDSIITGYLCPFSSNHKYPEEGKLGDLQILTKADGNYTFAMSQDISICTPSFYSGPQCQSQDSFLWSLSQVCFRLPAVIDGSHYSLDDTTLIIKNSRGLSVTFSHPGDYVVGEGKDCSIAKTEVNGVAGSLMPYQFVAYVDRIRPQGFALAVIPCLNTSLMVSCKEMFSIFEIPSNLACLHTLVNTTVNVIGAEEASYLRVSHLTAPGALDNDHDVGFWKAFSSAAFNKFLLTLSSAPFLLILALAFLLLRR